MTAEVTARTSIKRAAKMMDRAKPGWYRRIVFKRLDMQDACNCIAGQGGLDWLGLESEYEDRYRDTPLAPFADPDAVPYWVEEIRARRQAARNV